jgi:hypothetical protein
MLNATSAKSYGIPSSIATSLWFDERHVLMWRREKPSRHGHTKQLEESTAAHTSRLYAAYREPGLKLI